MEHAYSLYSVVSEWFCPWVITTHYACMYKVLCSMCPWAIYYAQKSWLHQENAPPPPPHFWVKVMQAPMGACLALYGTLFLCLSPGVPLRHVLLPFDMLPKREKENFRILAQETLKFLLLCGYRVDRWGVCCVVLCCVVLCCVVLCCVVLCCVVLCCVVLCCVVLCCVVLCCVVCCSL